MTKDDFIERLARRWAERDEGDSGVTWAWDDDDMDEFRDAWRRNAREFLPLIGDLIEEWLREHETHDWRGMGADDLWSDWVNDTGDFSVGGES
jgi:hypothetical protein